MRSIDKPKVRATLIAGDGIGPEITKAVVDILSWVGAPFTWDEQLAGAAAIERYGDPLPDETLDSIRRNGLALKGPLATPVGGGFRSVNVRLRQEFDLYANVRPAKSMLPHGRFRDIDIVLFRENLEGFYAVEERYEARGSDAKALAFSTGFNSRAECRRIAQYAFDYAARHNRKRVTIVHKANILKALTGLFLEEALEVAKSFPEIAVDDRIVDACAMQLVMNPNSFDVIVTTNMFGDILSDLIAGLIGGLGLAPGANIGKQAAIFEAIHGSAPDIASKGIANPSALLLAATMMLDHIGRHDLALLLRKSIMITLADKGSGTPDLGGRASTAAFAESIMRNIDKIQHH
jgi:isocitrate dehydrogenase (NAD+)